MSAHTLQCKQRQRKLRKLLTPWCNLIKEVPPSHWRGRVRLQLSSLSLCFPCLISCHPDLTIFLEAWNQLSLIIYLFCFVLLWIPLFFFFFFITSKMGKEVEGLDRSKSNSNQAWMVCASRLDVSSPGVGACLRLCSRTFSDHRGPGNSALSAR